MKKSLLLLMSFTVLAGGIPVDSGSLNKLPTYYGAEEDKTGGVNSDIYEDYGLPADFYPALIPSDYDGNSDYYYNSNYSNLPIISDEKGCSSVKTCPNHQFDPFAPMHGIKEDDSNVSSRFSREWKCHIETNCVALDEIPTDVQNDTDVLFLRYFNMSTLRDGALSSLPPLLKLRIESSELAVLEKGVFTNQGSIQYLELTANLIEELQPVIFRELEKLQSLEMTDNLIRKLERSTFNGLKSLTVLKLGGNQLRTIDDDVFRELPELKELHLDDNNITILSRHVFRGLNKLTALYLSQNYFLKVPNLALRGLPSLEILHMTENLLTRISKADFRGLDKLQELRLDQCDIKTISKRAFRGKNLTFLDVSANKLTKLSDFGLVGQKLSMQLAFNPWICNCSLTATTNWITTYRVTIIPPEPRCHAPFYKARRRITDLTNKQLCDPTATLPPMEEEKEVPWLNFPDESDTSLPEGRWSDKVYDIEKLYPSIQTITPIIQSTANGKSGTESGGENRSVTHDEDNKGMDGQTVIAVVGTGVTASSGPSPTTDVNVRLISDHIMLVVLILGISIPILLIIVLILHTNLKKKSNTDKSDIAMPHTETKCAKKKDLQISREYTPGDVVEPKTTNKKPAETLNPSQKKNELSRSEEDTTMIGRKSSSTDAQSIRIPTNNSGQSEHDGTVTTEIRTDESVVNHDNSEKSSDK